MPFVTVVTDLGGAHPSWFNGGVDRCFVPSDVLRVAALDRNVDSSRIVQYGLLIQRGFWRFGPTRTSRDARRPGTSRRMRARTWTSRPSGSDWLSLSSSSLLLSSPSLSYQMVVVCGNKKSAHASLSPPKTQWGSDIDVRVQGFVNNMDEYMCASGD